MIFTNLILMPNFQVLLERCQMDTDDEVRDRATYYHSILQYDNPILTNRYIVDSLQVKFFSNFRFAFATNMLAFF